jgi:hypothetical protein
VILTDSRTHPLRELPPRFARLTAAKCEIPQLRMRLALSSASALEPESNTASRLEPDEDAVQKRDLAPENSDLRFGDILFAAHNLQLA